MEIIDLRALFRKETGTTENTDGLCECGIFRLQDQDYIKWLESKLAERMEHHNTMIPELQARKMIWKLCDELDLEKSKTVTTMLDIWRECQFIK